MTGRADTGMYKYTVTNVGGTSHSVGIRIMVDTMVAGNDGAPFRVPGVGDVWRESEFASGNMPQYWQAFESLTDTRYVAQGP